MAEEQLVKLKTKLLFQSVDISWRLSGSDDFALFFGTLWVIPVKVRSEQFALEFKQQAVSCAGHSELA